MAVRKVKFANGEFYHVFNRGTDKRDIFLDEYDLERFFQGMEEFNSLDPIGSIFENSFRKESLGSKASKSKKLVNFICYCLNPNHYHFILEQVADSGIKKFMHKLGTGYSKYFNYKNKRNGALFQGKFKAVHIDSDPQLLHTSIYVNLNDKVHSLGSKASKLVKSSWGEYTGKNHNNFCEKEIILSELGSKAYKEEAEESLKWIKEKKDTEKVLLE